MSSALNAQKVPLNRSLNMVAHKRALDVIARLGQALPCTVTAVQGSIVTVKCEVSGPFTIPQLTVPKAESQWLRTPTQVGDHGILIPVDALLNAVTGLGGTAPNVTNLVANLSALAFLPIGSKSFSAADDPNAVVLYGPNGAVIRDSSSASKIVLTPSGITVTTPGPVKINGNLQVTGGIIAGFGTGDQVGLQTHTHPSNGSPPTPGT
jgi:hypothetical protein